MKELRLLVTDYCNFKCFFCHNEGNTYNNCKELLTPEDYQFLFLVGKASLNSDSVSITGGEPLLRQDIQAICSNIYNAKGKITLITNFSKIDQHEFIGEYISKLHVSVHTVDDVTEKMITGSDYLVSKVIKNLSDFHFRYPTVEITLNCTVNKYNSRIEDIKSMVDLSNELGANINFSELYYSDKQKESSHEIVDVDFINRWLKNEGYLYKGSTARADVYEKNNVIRLLKILCVNAKKDKDPSAFCKSNRDIFVTPGGKIDICRNLNKSIDIYREIKERNGDGLANKLLAAVKMMGNNCMYVHT